MLRLTNRASGVQAPTLLRGSILLCLLAGGLELSRVPVLHQLLPDLIPYPMGLASTEAGISQHIREAVRGLHMEVLLDPLLILYPPRNPLLKQYNTLIKHYNLHQKNILNRDKNYNLHQKT